MNIGNISKYETFLMVAQTGSLTAAAGKLGYTQSGVSRIISDLEKEFGFTLLRRSKNGCALTKEGEQLIEPMRHLLHAGDMLSQTVDQINGLRTGRVRVGLFSSAAMHWAPGIVTGFQKQYPNVEVEFYAGLYKEINSMVESEELDCGFLTKQAKGELSFTELKQDRLMAVIPPEHPFSQYDVFPVSAFEKVDFIIPGEGSHNDIGRIFEESGIHPRVRYIMPDDAGALSMVEHGLGVTIFPELMLDHWQGKVKALPLNPPFIRTIGIAYRQNRTLSPAARAFINFTVQWVKENT